MFRRDLIAPLCQGRESGWLTDVVVAEVAVDDLGELSLEAAEGFCGGLVFGPFALVVGASGPGVHGLDAGGHVERVVERSVAGAREPVAGLFAA